MLKNQLYIYKKKKFTDTTTFQKYISGRVHSTNKTSFFLFLEIGIKKAHEKCCLEQKLLFYTGKIKIFLIQKGLLIKVDAEALCVL